MEWSREIRYAEKAAYTAGERLRNIDPSRIIDDSGRDIKHDADLESEKFILDFLRSKFDYPILSEESSKPEPHESESGLMWIVDPLDGTLNFTKGIGFCCISIALWQHNEPVLGVIYDFQRDELFKGIVNHGALLNDRPIDASKGVLLPGQAVLATGFPVNRDFSPESISTFIVSIRSFKKIRLLGSAGLSLAYVACGRTDAYFEEDIMLWDVAAGIAIVKAAGGFVWTVDSDRKPWAKTIKAGNVFFTEIGHDSI